MKRTETLLLSIADDFERGAQPMNEHWLAENNVELDELQALCGKLYLIIRGWAMAPDKVKGAIIACAAADDKQTAEYMSAVALRPTIPGWTTTRPSEQKSTKTPES